MEQDDEEFEKLLGEIPRATSAPPHLEELQRALGVQLHDGSFLNAKDEAMKPVTESRAEEFYEGFYRPFPGARKSLESIEDGVFSDPPMLSPKSASVQLSSFYSGLALDDSRTSYQLRQLGLQQKQETQIHSPHSSQGQLQHSSSSGLADHLSKPQSEQQMLHDDQALSSAFVKLNFEESPIVEAGAQSRVDKGKSNGALEHVMSTGLTNESDSVVSSGLYPHGNATSPAFGSASEESLESRLPRSLPSLDLFSQNVSSMRGPLGNGLPSGFDELPMETAGHVMEKRPLQRAPGVDLLSNGRSSLEPGEAGYLSTNHHPQQQQNSVAAYTHAVAAMAAAAMQSGCQYPNINGNELFPPSVGQQVQYPLDTDMASFVQAQRMQEAAIVRAQQQMEERVWYRQRMQQEFLLRQQQLQEQQARFYASLQGQPGAPGSTYSRVHAGTQPCHQPSLNSSLAFNLVPQQPLPKPTLTGSMTFDGGWKQQQSQGAWAAPMVVPEAGRPSHGGNVCRYFAQGFCCRGVTCPFLHFQPQSGNTNHVAVNTGGNASSHDPPFSEKMSPRKSPRNGQVVPGVSIILSGSRKKESLVNGHSNGHLLSNGNHLSALNQLDSVNGDSKASSGAASRRSLDLETLRSLNMQHHLPQQQQQQQQQQQPKYTTLQEVEGRIYIIAKDQHGCRFLQRKFEEGATEDVQNIFTEIIDHIVELMTDPFGNYLVQKLLEVCSETQRMEILCRVTGKGQLVTISLNMHGTRAVQKLIETLKSSEQVAMVISSLRQGVVSLIKDLNGNHVVQRCLQRLSNEDSQFIFDAAVAHCVEIATHRHGCCVLQRCVDFASGHQRQQLVTEIAANALVLSQDPFGNYVVQYILDLGISRATMEVITRLEGNYPHLAMQKFSSNVVEKCLKLAGEENKAQIIQELLSSSRLGQLLQDPYANYVVQSALTVSKGGLHTGLVEAIRPHLPALRSSPYGKRILSRTNLKK